MKKREVELTPGMSESAMRKELRRLEPEFCPNCALKYERKDVKELPPEHSEQIRWSAFCGYCGATYCIEVEP